MKLCRFQIITFSFKVFFFFFFLKLHVFYKKKSFHLQLLFLCTFIAKWCCYCFCVFLQLNIHVVDFVHFYNQMLLLLILCAFYRQVLLLLILYAFVAKCCWCWCCTLLQLNSYYCWSCSHLHQLLLILCAFVGTMLILLFFALLSQMLLSLFFLFLQLVIVIVVLCTFATKCWYYYSLCSCN